MCIKNYLFGILVCFVSCKTSNTAYKVSEATWEEVKSVDESFPVARHEAAFVNVKDKFYLLGGRGIRPVSIYDTKMSVWTKGAKPPIEMHHFQPVVHENLVYIIGAMTGRYPSERPVANIYIYNTITNTWLKGDAIPASRLRGSTGNALYKNKIYISCGIKNGHIGDHKKWLDSYDLTTKEWSVLPDAPIARDHFQAAIVDRKMYLIGGRQSKAPDETFKHTIAEVNFYDIKNNEWTTLANNLPTLRAGNMATAIHNNIWVIGGESDDQPTAHNEVEVLNTTTGNWQKKPSLIKGRHGTGIIIYKNACYVASGSGNKGGSPELKSMEKLKY